MKQVRYGLIGFGAHAELCYAECILKQKLVKNATIAAVTEPSEKRRKMIPSILPKNVKFLTEKQQILRLEVLTHSEKFESFRQFHLLIPVHPRHK